MILWFLDKADIVAYAAESIRSATHSFRLPSVVRLRQFVRHRPPERAPFIRENVFLRDRYSCQYCGDTLPAKHLTLDHVQPLSKGGGHNWENVVTACSPCNNRKGNKTPDGAAMPLQKPPKALRSLSTEGITSGLKEIPDSWREFLPAKTG